MAQRGVIAFTDTKALTLRIDAYFDSLTKTRTFRGKGDDGKPISWEEDYQVPPTMAGLALALDTTRVTLLHYGKGEGTRDDGFIPVIARAKMRIAEFAETALYTREAGSGAQFALRVNHGYGLEEEGGRGEGFTVVTVPPAANEALVAIPKWTPEET